MKVSRFKVKRSTWTVRNGTVHAGRTTAVLVALALGGQQKSGLDHPSKFSRHWRSGAPRKLRDVRGDAPRFVVREQIDSRPATPAVVPQFELWPDVKLAELCRFEQIPNVN